MRYTIVFLSMLFALGSEVVAANTLMIPQELYEVAK